MSVSVESRMWYVAMREKVDSRTEMYWGPFSNKREAYEKRQELAQTMCTIDVYRTWWLALVPEQPRTGLCMSDEPK